MIQAVLLVALVAMLWWIVGRLSNPDRPDREAKLTALIIDGKVIVVTIADPGEGYRDGHRISVKCHATKEFSFPRSNFIEPIGDEEFDS